MQPGKDHGGDAIQFEPFTPPSMEELDALIPGYKFVEFIERGGMGAVYKAVQKSLNRTVAVKLLPQVHRNKESFAERFKREAHALALLNHPHIIAVHDFGETKDGQMFYAMEFVSGMDLQQLLKRAPPGPKQILKIVNQVCDALQFAHERGIVHRDIKPANILIDERGNVKVADFGLVKIVGPQISNYTATGATLGTPDYIAPEALDQSSKIDHRADIYSLGVMIYELLTGHVPKGAWEPPSACSGSDKRIDAVVNRAMQNDPDKRYQQVSEMTQALEKLLVNSDNWKNYRRPEKSNISVAGAPVGPISTGAVTVKLKHGKLPVKHTLAWVTSIVLLLGVGFSAAWQAGWLASASATPTAPAVPPQPAPAASEQLKLARWVMEHGGLVNVLTPTSTEKQQGGYADIHFAHELPAGPITVWRVSFLEAPITDLGAFEELVALIRAAGAVSNLNLHGLAVPTSALKHLADIPTLTSLDLMSSPAVTLAAVPLLAACTQLKLLRVGDAAVIEQLRPLLPECGIHNDE